MVLPFFRGRILLERAVLLFFCREMVFSAGGFTIVSWYNERLYYFWEEKCVLERAVLPWNHSRTDGSTNFSGRNCFRAGDFTMEFCYNMRFYKFLGDKWFLERAVIPWNHGRTGGSNNF